MSKYIYAVQWHYKCEEDWYTLEGRYTELKLARIANRRFRKQRYDGVETRIVRRPIMIPWEVVE